MRIKTTMLLTSLATLVAAILVVSCTPVKQIDHPEPETPKAFAFENVDATYSTIKVDIVPEDKTAEYVVLFAEKKHFAANNIDTREELIEDDLDMLRSYAEYYGVTIREFLEGMKWLVKGDKVGYEVVNLYPDTEYVVYCYGVEIDGDSYTATTEVCYEVITTETPVLIDARFDISSAVDGNIATINIVPEGYDGYYYHYIVPSSDQYYLPEGAEFSDAYLAYYRNKAFSEFNYLINDLGTPVSHICHKGAFEVRESLAPNNDYLILAFAVSNDKMPILCSVPELHYFTTGETKMSDLTIAIEVSDITSYNAMLTVTPSKKDEEYACVFLADSQLPAFDSEYEELMFIVENFDPAIFKGPFSEALTPLMPGTEYVVVAFGVKNSMPTTAKFEYRFSSLEAGKSGVNIESIDIVGLYDAQEIIALDSSYERHFAECECVAIVEAKTSVPTDKLYFWWYEEWMRVEYSEEAFLEDLLMYDYASNPEVMDMYYSMNEQDRFIFAGIAEDEEGNMSEIFYSEPFLLSKDMCDPAEEFFSWLSGSRANVMILKR
ncbi:MAG: hypothetical protein IKT66_05185 [Alistipes sp.]|nr:hypothetical protein [Alistipes sp.]